MKKRQYRTHASQLVQMQTQTGQHLQLTAQPDGAAARCNLDQFRVHTTRRQTRRHFARPPLTPSFRSAFLPPDRSPLITEPTAQQHKRLLTGAQQSFPN